MHEASPGAEGLSIHRQDIEGLGDLFQPGLDLACLCGILLPRDLDPGLDLADGHGREVQIGVGNALQPGQNRAVRLRPAKLRNNVGVQQIYPVQVITRKLAGEMTRKLSETESRKCDQFRGIF